MNILIFRYHWVMEDAEKFFETYCDFVTKVTSDPSLKIEDLKKSLDNIQENSDIDTPRLLTAALGLGSETGEFVEIVKKMISQSTKNPVYLCFMLPPIPGC